MHTFLAFFAWPDGGVWSNVLAMPLCGIVAALATVCLRKPLSNFWHRHFGHRAELDALRKQLDAHADMLDVRTPGGLATILDEVRRAVTAAESAHEGVKALGVITSKVQQPAPAGPTPMKRTAGGRFAPRSSSEGKS